MISASVLSFYAPTRSKVGADIFIRGQKTETLSECFTCSRGVMVGHRGESVRAGHCVDRPTTDVAYQSRGLFSGQMPLGPATHTCHSHNSGQSHHNSLLTAQSHLDSLGAYSQTTAH